MASEGFTMIVSFQIDAALTVDSFDSDTTKLSLVEPTFSCTLGGRHYIYIKYKLLY